MIISNVNIGSGPGFNDGESIYSAFYKVNQNFANVQSNVNSLTNSVSSVAGRTGNVTLTINDIVGLNTTYSTQANLASANVAMRGYVDAKIAANIAALIDSAPGTLDTLNELAAALNDDASFATTIVNTVTLANTIQSQQIASANVGIIGYINLANTIQSQQIASANLGIIGYVDNTVSTANLGMKGYVDSVASQSIYGNANVASYLPSYSGNLTADVVDFNFLTVSDGPSGLNALYVGIPGISPFGNAIASFHSNISAPSYINVHNKSAGDQNLTGFVATAYASVDPERYNITLQIAGENYSQPAIPMFKPFDGILETIGGNLLISAHDTDFSANKDIIFTTGLVPMYEKVRISNSSVRVSTDIIPSANVTYSLGNITHQWKDLFVSNSTIYIGGTALTVSDGSLLINNNTISTTSTVTAANLGMKGYVDSLTYSNVQTTAYLTTNNYLTETSANLSNYAWASNVGSTYSNVEVAAYLPTYTGNISANYFNLTSNSSALSFNNGAYIYGDQVNRIGSIVLQPAASGTFPSVIVGGAGRLAAPNGSVHVIFNSSDLTVQVQQKITAGTSSSSTLSGALVVTGGVGISGNINVGGNASVTGILTNNYYYANGTPVSFGGSSYSNVEVGVFTNLSNYAYNANVTAANVGMKGYVDSLTYSNVQAESFITTFSGNVPQASLAYTVNISPVIVNLEYQLALLPAKEGAWGIKAADGTANVTYNPVSNRLTSANVQATGSIQTSGINGRIGYSAGGFVQQITANSNGVSLNTVSGNIQLMGINLGVNGLHTVSFTNNKLEETDLILVSHHSGGVSNFAVGAYYAAPSTAIIWIRNITGADTSTVTPMLKFALIKAPGA